MYARDFIIQVRSDLQEKSQHWKDEELFVKLQRAYVELQYKLPFFIVNETLSIEEGKTAYRLSSRPIKNVSLKIDNTKVDYSDNDYFYAHTPLAGYTFDNRDLLLGFEPTKACDGVIYYKTTKTLDTMNCVLEIPSEQHVALEKLFKSKIYEKPVLNSKERNLSAYYLGLYNKAVDDLKKDRPTRPKNVGTRYKIV